MCVLNGIKIETYYPPTPTYTNTSNYTSTFTRTSTSTNTWDPMVPTYTPTFSNTQTRTYTVTMSPTFTSTVSFTAIRVNVAGPALTNAYGNAWSADKAYVAGSCGYQTAGATNDRSTEVVDPFALAAQESRIYQTERWSNSAQYIDYAFDAIPSSYYTVRLHFAAIS